MTAADKFGIAFSIGFTVALLAVAMGVGTMGKAAPAPVVPTTPTPAPVPPAPEQPATPPAPAETPAEQTTTPAEETPAEQPPAEQAPTEETPEEPAPTEEAPEESMGDMIMSLDVSISEGASSPGCEADSSCFVESDATVSTGGTVTWTNNDSAAHTVTSGTPTDGPDGVFDSSIIMAGKTFEFTFDKAGEYNYFCVVHPWMTGKVTVE